jgi:hypothetical protein
LGDEGIALGKALGQALQLVFTAILIVGSVDHPQQHVIKASSSTARLAAGETARGSGVDVLCRRVVFRMPSRKKPRTGRKR